MNKGTPLPAVVMFVDDDPNVIEGFKRMIRVMHPDWTPIFASSSGEALIKLAGEKIDVVVADLNMPHMDGVELLNRVQGIYPHTIRLILSSETDPDCEAILRATKSVHQVLVKPCKAEVLQSVITRALELRQLLKNPDLVNVLNGIPFLPSLPPLYHELLRALESPDTSMDQIGAIISQDVSMTGRVLHLVNSAFFGLPRNVTSPAEAAVLLGVKIIKALVMYVRLFFSASDCTIPGLSLEELWAHSSLTGTLAKEIVNCEKGPKAMMEEALLAGMMHDIGKILVLDIEGYVPKVLSEMESGKDFVAAEYHVFKASHAEIGAYLMGLWGLPDGIVAAVACHHRPTHLTQSEFSILTATHVANAFLMAEAGQKPQYDYAYLEKVGVVKRIPAWEKMAGQLVGKLKTS